MLDVYELREGIFSLDESRPGPAKGLVLAVQPFLGIPLDKRGMQEYVRQLYGLGDMAKPARLYQIGIKLLINLGTTPLVWLEKSSRLDELLLMQWRSLRGNCEPAQSYIVSVSNGDLLPGSPFPYRLSAFLEDFQVENIGLAGRCDRDVTEYLSRLPKVRIGGIETRLKFLPIAEYEMTAERNPLAYVLMKESTSEKHCLPWMAA